MDIAHDCCAGTPLSEIPQVMDGVVQSAWGYRVGNSPLS